MNNDNNNIQRMIVYRTEFNKSLNSARERLSLNNDAGRKIDNIITPIYKEYGFYNSARHDLDLDLTTVASSVFKFFMQDSEEIFKELGIDMDLYRSLAFGGKASVKDQVELIGLHKRASNALADIKRKINTANNSGNVAWDFYGNLAHISAFANKITDLKDNDMVTKKEITEHLQKLIYYKPNKIKSNISETCKTYKVSESTLQECFKSVIGTSIEEYSTMINEAVWGDLQQGVKNAGNKIMGAITPNRLGGQNFKNKAAAGQGQASINKEVGTLMHNWYKTTTGEKGLATAKNLTNWLSAGGEWTNPLSYHKLAVSQALENQKDNMQNGVIPDNQLQNFFKDLVMKDRKSSFYGNADDSEAANIPNTSEPKATNTKEQPFTVSKGAPFPGNPLSGKKYTISPQEHALAQAVANSRKSNPTPPSVNGNVHKLFVSIMSLPPNQRIESLKRVTATLSKKDESDLYQLISDDMRSRGR